MPDESRSGRSQQPIAALFPYNSPMSKPDPKTAPFGSVFTDLMAVATYKDGAWSAFELNLYELLNRLSKWV